MNIGIYRTTRNKWIFGVCGGLAERLGVDVRWVRLATVVVPALPGGLGIPPVVLVYIALGILLPRDTERTTLPR